MRTYFVTAVAGFMIFGCGARVVSLDVKSEVKVANNTLSLESCTLIKG